MYNAYYTKHQRNFARSEHGKALATVFDDAATGQKGGLVQCLSQSHYKEMTMFDMTLPQNLGVLAIQHETLPVDTLQSVGQAAGAELPSIGQIGDDGSRPPAKLLANAVPATLDVASALPDVPLPGFGQGASEGSRPPPKLVGNAMPATLDAAGAVTGAESPNFGQGSNGGQRPPPKLVGNAVPATLDAAGAVAGTELPSIGQGMDGGPRPPK